MGDLATFDMAAGLGDLEPAHVLERAARAPDRRLDRILDAGGGRADELDQLVGVLGHGCAPLPLLWLCQGNGGGGGKVPEAGIEAAGQLKPHDCWTAGLGGFSRVDAAARVNA